VRERKWTSKELVRNLLRRDRLNGSQGTYVLIRYFRPPILHSFRAPVSPLSRVHELLGTPIPRSDAHCLLDEARHELARHYLLHSSRELNETAYLSGYEDANSFFRAFQHREGTSPGHWRALQKSTSSTMQAQVGAV
jgi:AraC-like DNA-binding protein